MGTATGRYSHANPNLAQMPKPNEKGVFGNTPLRGAFKPREGYKFVVYDYSSCELRILAEVSRDPGLIQNIVLDDPHTANASLMFSVPIEEVTKAMRDRAKNGIYLKTYAGGPARLAATLNIPVAEAKAVFEALDRAMPGLPEWGERVKKQAITRGYTTTLSGRKRFYDTDVAHLNWRGQKARLAEIERQAGNAPIQGTNADITKLAMVMLDPEFAEYDAHLLIQVHDELVAECPEQHAEEVSQVMRRVMLSAEMEFLKRAESKVEGGWGDGWTH